MTSRGHTPPATDPAAELRELASRLRRRQITAPPLADAIAYVMTALADHLDPRPPTCTCGLHSQHCEPPSELCCQDCTEVDHPAHHDGRPCVLPAGWTRPAVGP